jgi:type IV pilus assembly protein PilE
MKKYNRGFTLMELMIVVAIIGLLAAVGYPAYTNAVKKGQRADAIDSLLTLASSMEEYYMVNDTYKNATIANTIGSATSSEGYYTVSINTQDDFYYKVKAVAVNGDTDCGDLFLDSTGKKSSSIGSGCW